MHSLSCLILLGALVGRLGCNDGRRSNHPSTDASHDLPAIDGARSAAHAAGDTRGTDAANVSDAIALTDPQIVGVVNAVDDSEIEKALMAVGAPDGGIDGRDPLDSGFDAGLARSANATVVMFANMTIADHARSHAAIGALGIVPMSSGVQAALEHTSKATLAHLSPLLGSAFDIAYVQSQVTAHTAILDVIENRLIPAARDPQLKMHLCGTSVPVVETHLAAATALFALLTRVRSLDGAASSDDLTE